MSDSLMHAGFNISDTKLQVVEAIFDGNGFVLENVEEVFFSEPVDFLNQKPTIVLSLLQEAYDEISLRVPLKTQQVSFTLPLSCFYINQLPADASLFYQDLIEQYRWELALLYPGIDTENLVLQALPVETSTLGTNDTAIIAALDRSYLKTLSSFAAKNGMQLQFVDNVHFSANRILFQGNEDLHGITLSMYFADNVLSLMLMADGVPATMKAARIKGAGELPKVLEEELFHTPLFSLRRPDIRKVFLFGDQMTESLAQKIEEEHTLPVLRKDPFQPFTVPPALEKSSYVTEKFYRFAAPAGIALRVE